MCGLVGAYWVDPPSNPKHRLQTGISALQHRGPNDQGVEFLSTGSGTLALGHTRLSIIDLSPAGHQPMFSQCGRYVLIFNGEIYNYRELRQDLKGLGYRFVSDSDTEVLLVSWIAWGQDCLSRLRGMFAFVVYDRTQGTLTCVRDAFGIKPFFYHRSKDGFLFASEMPAMLALLSERPTLNPQRAYDYLVTGAYDNGADTFFTGVHQLLPGHRLTLNLSENKSIETQRWWWPEITECADLSFADATEQLRSMFLNNVRLHLRSDVSLGAALSGGIDSSAVVCAIRHIEPKIPIHTFSYVARGSEMDEERWVDLVNAHIGAVSHKVVIRPEELANDLDDMIRAQGEPFGSTSIYAQYRVFKLAHEHGVTVTLDGQGADELLAGYWGYPGPAMHSLIETRQFFRLARFLRMWSRWPGRSIGFGLKALLEPFVPFPLRGLARRIVGHNPAPAWLNASFFDDRGVTIGWPVSRGQSQDKSGRRLVAALRQSLTGDGLNSLLRHGDRNSMRWSVESRVPFLTTDMAEFLLRLPEHCLISRQGETKHIFRAAMRGIVPDAILDRKDKIGFATPEQTWLGQLGNKLDDWLDFAETMPFLDEAKCKAEVISMVQGEKLFDWRAWRLINFCRWARLMDVSI
uniref:asparagine synthase (glutamine-hydrolyzing) n=1 Tax=Candidatus Kentrum sp. SD TaxID=2126332 RepID=A0A450YDB9_9GAMM|nr:MAG: asparagine synthase (glutamine-hydrolysing) [Candidatus Kentron sp. SD]VFK44541.1 MAG: asparagine synthase (glutamine-hydrolysing) [Candidatus Kentron sp. SD]